LGLIAASLSFDDGHVWAQAAASDARAEEEPVSGGKAQEVLASSVSR